MAVDQALESVRNHKIGAVPNHLRDAHYKGAAKLGHGIGYKYAHDYPDHYVKQQYLPDELLGTTFYEPTENGYEKNIKEYLAENANITKVQELKNQEQIMVYIQHELINRREII